MKKKPKSAGNISRTPKFIFALIAGIIAFIILVQVLFSLPASSELFKAKWQAGELLTFWGPWRWG